MGQVEHCAKRTRSLHSQNVLKPRSATSSQTPWPMEMCTTHAVTDTSPPVVSNSAATGISMMSLVQTETDIIQLCQFAKQEEVAEELRRLLHKASLAKSPLAKSRWENNTF